MKQEQQKESICVTQAGNPVLLQYHNTYAFRFHSPGTPDTFLGSLCGPGPKLAE